MFTHKKQRAAGAAGRAMSVHHQHGFPKLKLRRLAVVGREYKGTKDQGFSPVFLEVVRHADQNACDSILFALYTTDWSWQRVLDELNKLSDLKHVRSIFVEHLDPTAPRRTSKDYGVYHRLGNDPWEMVSTNQLFGQLRTREDREKIGPFLERVRRGRTLGNCAVILCGETNVLKYTPSTRRVTDPHGYLAAVSRSVAVFLNPIHDRMTRHEMVAKRRFLSRGRRWLVSVWNRGKRYSDGKTRDGKRPPWLIFYDGQKFELAPDPTFQATADSSVQIGVLDIVRKKSPGRTRNGAL